jgi:hypothetical protein
VYFDFVESCVGFGCFESSTDDRSFTHSLKTSQLTGYTATKSARVRARLISCDLSSATEDGLRNRSVDLCVQGILLPNTI